MFQALNNGSVSQFFMEIPNMPSLVDFVNPDASELPFFNPHGPFLVARSMQNTHIHIFLFGNCNFGFFGLDALFGRKKEIPDWTWVK